MSDPLSGCGNNTLSALRIQRAKQAAGVAATMLSITSDEIIAISLEFHETVDDINFNQYETFPNVVDALTKHVNDYREKERAVREYVDTITRNWSYAITQAGP